MKPRTRAETSRATPALQSVASTSTVRPSVAFATRVPAVSPLTQGKRKALAMKEPESPRAESPTEESKPEIPTAPKSPTTEPSFPILEAEPQAEPVEPTIEELPTSLANIALMQRLGETFSKALREQGHPPKEGKVSVNKPDEFTGEDPSVLKNFIAQCEMVFRSRPSLYESDSSRITFVASYFRKTAQEWWQPYLLNPPNPPPSYLIDYLDFVDELYAQFGEVDPEAEAEEKLDNLRMKPYHRAARYSVEFTSLAARTRYDEFALRRRFYKGLPDRIKDKLIEPQSSSR